MIQLSLYKSIIFFSKMANKRNYLQIINLYMDKLQSLFCPYDEI